MSRYSQPPPRRRTGWAIVGRIVLWLVIALMVTALGLVGGAYLYFHESVASVQARSQDVKQAEKQLDLPPPPGHAAIALILGYDHRAGEGNAPSRSDTILLLRADPQTKSVSMLSFPRDLLVDIHCPGVPVYVAKINAAYARCRSAGTLETVKALTGLPVNYLITVNFRGFRDIVNQLGGVWIDVDRRYFNDNNGVAPGFGYAAINLQPGYQRLFGVKALDFARFRHTDSDLYRVARQQLVVKALKAQFAKHFSPSIGAVFSIPKLVGAITRNVEVGAGGAGHVSERTILSWAEFLYGLPGGRFFQAKIGGLTGYSDLTTAPSNITQAVSAFVQPDLQASKVATQVILHQKVRTATPKPADTTVVTLNGSGHIGDGSTAGSLLSQQGYRTVQPPANATGNAPDGFNHFKTTVYYNPAISGALPAANALVKLFAPADVGKLTAPIKLLSNGAMTVVVVGKTFHGTIGAAPIVNTPTYVPPEIVNNPAATESLLHSVARQTRFPLEVPAILEQSSVPDPELPVRAYKVDGKHWAVRLTFRTGAREYWGIEETTWTDAPVLSEKNFHRVLGGRSFDLHYDGQHLHMVVLHANGATYWVVNTLLDSLSNETMLAIAKGLRPLPPR
jgi:LCP family protein required for cell wall assembly